MAELNEKYRIILEKQKESVKTPEEKTKESLTNFIGSRGAVDAAVFEEKAANAKKYPKNSKALRRANKYVDDWANRMIPEQD